ncbi:hypothetical protein K474DRAFT_328488 [Panus rudis PR-1116 ss-1]|nr:hypothetical protein K474DRAFT_328488 [Panus rudis PR-1116 ss-1]
MHLFRRYLVYQSRAARILSPVWKAGPILLTFASELLLSTYMYLKQSQYSHSLDKYWTPWGIGSCGKKRNKLNVTTQVLTGDLKEGLMFRVT